MLPVILVTGSCGLIGSEACLAFNKFGFRVVGIDGNQRSEYFGAAGDTSWILKRLLSAVPSYRHETIDIRDRQAVHDLIQEVRPQLIIHTAAQPSHDRAAQVPYLDFEVNAGGTLNLLESVRRYCRDSVFIYMSTNKVYGDQPNRLPLKEETTRWEFDADEFKFGISETLTIDQSTHSLFGVSKLSGDLLVQEYGRYFEIPTCCLRCGCITGPNHSGVQLHGFLSYLVKCNIESREYTVFGYKGKQVRDNIHAVDVVGFMYEFFQRPRIGEVYNLGGGKSNSCSIIEAFRMVEEISGQKMKYRYDDENRLGDHICYYSDLRKISSDYHNWKLTKSLRSIIEEIHAGWEVRLNF